MSVCPVRLFVHVAVSPSVRSSVSPSALLFVHSLVCPTVCTWMYLFDWLYLRLVFISTCFIVYWSFHLYVLEKLSKLKLKIGETLYWVPKGKLPLPPPPPPTYNGIGVSLKLGLFWNVWTPPKRNLGTFWNCEFFSMSAGLQVCLFFSSYAC